MKKTYVLIVFVAVLLALPLAVLEVQRSQNIQSRAGSDCYSWPDANGGTSTGLQKAVNGHLCVKVAAGTYNLDKPITIPSNRQIVGSGADSTIFKAVNGIKVWPSNNFEGVFKLLNLKIVELSFLTLR